MEAYAALSQSPVTTPQIEFARGLHLQETHRQRYLAPSEQPSWFGCLNRRTTLAFLFVWWLAWLVYGALSIAPYFESIGWDSVTTHSKELVGRVSMEKGYTYFPYTMLSCDVGLLELTCEADNAACPRSLRHVRDVDTLLSSVMRKVKGHSRFMTYDSVDNMLLMGMPRAQSSPQRFRHPSGRAEIFTICAGGPDVDFSKEIVALLDAENPDPTNVRVGLASTSLLADSTIEAVKRDMPLIDCTCLPAAFALMGYLLRSGRLLLIAVLNLVIAMITTFGVIYLICHYSAMIPDPTQINFVMIIGLGLNFDYSLFLLSRFITFRARDGKAAIELAVLEMLRGVGPVILSSGLTLTIVFSSFLFLTAGNLVMAGLGCAVTTAVVMLVSLTVIPAILLTWPVFFGSVASSAAYAVEPGRSFSTDDEVVGILTLEETAVLLHSRQARLWRFVTTWPTNIVLVIALHAVALCAGLPTWDLRLNNDISEVAPRSGVAYRTLQALQRYAPVEGGSAVDGFLGFVGQTDEFVVIIEAESKGSVRDTKKALRTCGYDLTAEVARKLIDLPVKTNMPFRLAPDAIFAPGWARGVAINFTKAMAWEGAGMFTEEEKSHAVSYMADTMRTCVGECFKQPGEGKASRPAATIMKAWYLVDALLSFLRLIVRESERFCAE